MEPSDLKSNSSDDAQLEAWLRSHASLPPLADDGFSTRVMATLPPPRRRRSGRARVFVCLAGALAGIAVAWSQFRGVPDLADSFGGLAPAINQALDLLVDPAVSIAIGVTIASLAYVYWREIRLLPRL